MLFKVWVVETGAGIVLGLEALDGGLFFGTLGGECFVGTTTVGAFEGNVCALAGV